MVKTLTEKFVPVAVDQHIHRQRRDREGELFAAILKQAGRGLNGYSQGVYLFTADGRLLAFANTTDAAGVRRLTETALKKFDPKVAPTRPDDEPPPAVLPAPPEGGLVIAVTTKVLGGYDPDDPGTERYRQSLGRDHLWLRRDEAESLARGTIPESVARRLARYHLVDNTRGEPPMWRDDEVKSLELTLRDGRLAGSIHLETAARDRGYRAELSGVVEAKGGRVTRFDLVARGEFWGEGTFTRDAPPGRYPLAVAFQLADGDRPAGRVPPQGARGNVRGYLR